MTLINSISGSRSTSVKMKHVRGRGAIVPIDQTKKIIHHVNDLDVDKE